MTMVPTINHSLFDGTQTSLGPLKLGATYLVIGTGILIFHQAEVTIVVAKNDTPIWLQIERSNPAILAPQLLWLSTKSRTRLTSPRRLIPTYTTKNTSKNKKERNQVAHE